MLNDENDAKKEELKIGTRRIVMRSDSALVMRNVGAGKGRNSVVGSEKTPGVKRSKSKTVSPEGMDLGVTKKKCGFASAFVGKLKNE